MATRQSTSEYLQRDLDREAKENAHDRAQELQRTINNVVRYMIMGLPFSVAGLVILIVIGRTFGKYDTVVFENWLTGIVSGAGGYGVAYLKKNGVDKE